MLSNKIKFLIKSNNLTIKEFCKISNVDYNKINDLLNNNINSLQSSDIINICKAFEISLNELLDDSLETNNLILKSIPLKRRRDHLLIFLISLIIIISIIGIIIKIYWLIISISLIPIILKLYKFLDIKKLKKLNYQNKLSIDYRIEYKLFNKQIIIKYNDEIYFKAFKRDIKRLAVRINNLSLLNSLPNQIEGNELMYSIVFFLKNNEEYKINIPLIKNSREVFNKKLLLLKRSITKDLINTFILKFHNM